MRQLILPMKTASEISVVAEQMTPEKIEFANLLGFLLAERWSQIQDTEPSHDGVLESESSR